MGGKQERKDRRGGGERGRRPRRSPGVSADQSQDRHNAGLSKILWARAIQPADQGGGPCMAASWTRHHRAKESELPCGKVWPDQPTEAHGLTTGPCSILGVSRGPASAFRLRSQGRCIERLDNPRPHPRQRSSPEGPRLCPGQDHAPRRAAARNETVRGAILGAGTGRGKGSGRKPVMPA